MVGRVSSPRFVGRLDELGVLAAALARAQAGDGSLVLVSGDSGVGKSRLIAEAGSRARAAGATVAAGECPDLAQGELPCAPIVGALRSLARERGDEEFGSLLGPEYAGPGYAEREGAQVRLFARLLAALSEVAIQSPLLLVVEDLQWADRSTRDFISFLAASLRRERLVVVAATAATSCTGGIPAGGSCAVAAEIAYHWHAAHQPGRALPASIRAGLEAEAVQASALAREGLEAIRAAGARRFSLVPSFKIQIDVVGGNRAYLYFECHDVGDFDLPARQIVSDTFLAGTLRRARRRWVFADMTAGKAFPLSVDQYFFPAAAG
jgi:hypothetical protein